MENEFPSNSSRQMPEKVQKPETKKVEKVVQGEVVRRKKPLGKRFKELFGGGDVKGVMSFVVMDVIVPATKDLIVDAGQEALRRMIMGDSGAGYRRSSQRGGGRNGFVDYNYRTSSSNPSRNSRREEPRGSMNRRSRTSHDFDDIILATRVEAEEVVDRLFELISKYEIATISDLYELVGISGNYTDVKYGWTDIRGAGVTRISNGYLLDLPKPELLD